MPFRYSMEKVAGGDAVAEAAQVLPGDVTVTGRIAIVYAIR